MTALDTTFRTLATELLTLFGRPATIKEYESSTFVVATSTYTPGAATDHSVTISPFFDDVDRYFPQDVIEKGDAWCIVDDATLGEEPDKTMKLVVGSETWAIVQVETLNAPTLPAAYIMLVRK